MAVYRKWWGKKKRYLMQLICFVIMSLIIHYYKCVVKKKSETSQMLSCILLYTFLRKEHAWSLRAKIVTIQTKYQSKGNRERTFMEENQS